MSEIGVLNEEDAIKKDREISSIMSTMFKAIIQELTMFPLSHVEFNIKLDQIIR
jgi:hypothetical protein